MKQNKNIPEGYKDSPLGIIPNEWEVKRLGSITTKIGSGITPRGGESVYKKEGRMFLRSQNIGWGTLLLNDVAYIDETTHQKQSSTEVQEGDILLNITGASIGRSAVADKKVDKGNVNQHVCIIRLRDNILPYYINAYILSNQGQRAIDSFQAGGNRQGLNFEQIRTFYIPVPPLFEQRTIASVLSTWDKAIEKQTALIEKLEVRKRGLMRQLLTGKKRLPGFNKKWNKVKIEDVFYPLPSFSYSRDQLTNKPETIHCIHYGDIHVETDRYIVDLTNNTLPFIKKEIWNHQKYKNDIFLKEGDLIIADASEDYEGVGKSWEIVDTNNQLIISGLHTIALRPVAELFHTGFTCYLFRSITLLNKMREKAQGTKVYSLSFNNIKKISFSLPSIKEQIAIKKILLSCDKEIVINRRRLQSLKYEKKGLMEVLLTGKKRV